MSNDQEQNGGALEAGHTTLANSPFDDPSDNTLNGMPESVPFADFGTISNSKAMVPAVVPAALTLKAMLDVPIPLVFEVGRTKISIAHLMELREGSFIDLRNVSVDVIDVLVDDQIIAEAEAISLQQRYGVRISEITRIPSSEDLDDAS